MVRCDKWVAVKVFELLFCGACVAWKRVTDDEAGRVFLFRQKLSREWSLLNNITWSSAGSSMADAAYGGYVIITAGLLLGRVMGQGGVKVSGPGVAEKFFLIIGTLLFIVLGALELASVDSVPDDLVDNAAILGCLSLVVALLFILDLAGTRGTKMSASSSQTEPPLSSGYARFDDVTDGVLPAFTRFGSLRESSTKEVTVQLPPEKPKHVEIKKTMLPELQSPVFERVKSAKREHAVVSKSLEEFIDTGPYSNGGACNGGHVPRAPALPSSPRHPGYVQYAAMQWEQAAKNRRTPKRSMSPTVV